MKQATLFQFATSKKLSTNEMFAQHDQERQQRESTTQNKPMPQQRARSSRQQQKRERLVALASDEPKRATSDEIEQLAKNHATQGEASSSSRACSLLTKRCAQNNNSCKCIGLVCNVCVFFNGVDSRVIDALDQCCAPKCAPHFERSARRGGWRRKRHHEHQQQHHWRQQLQRPKEERSRVERRR